MLRETRNCLTDISYFNLKKIMSLEIEQEITNILAHSDADFLAVKTLLNRLPRPIIDSLGLPRATRSLSQIAIVRKLAPGFGTTLTNTKNSKGTQFIGFRLSPEALIKRALKKQPGISSKKLRQRLPLREAKFVTALNSLLQSEAVICTGIYPSHIIAGLRLPQVQTENQLLPEDREKAFKAAYLEIGNGRPYVLIHALRNRLRWTTADFDETLMDLSQHGMIELHSGDTSALTSQEVENSFTDSLGYILVSVSWRAR